MACELNPTDVKTTRAANQAAYDRRRRLKRLLWLALPLARKLKSTPNREVQRA